MLIKLNTKELKQARKEILKDISIQAIRSALNKEVNKVIGAKIQSHLTKLSSYNTMDRIVRNQIGIEVRAVMSKIKHEEIGRVQKIAKKDILNQMNIPKIEKEVKAELKKEILKKLGAEI